MIDFSKLRPLPKATPEMKAAQLEKAENALKDVLQKSSLTPLILTLAKDQDLDGLTLTTVIEGPFINLHLHIDASTLLFSEEFSLKFWIDLENKESGTYEPVRFTIENTTTFHPDHQNIFFHSIQALAAFIQNSNSYETSWEFQKQLGKSILNFRNVQGLPLTKLDLPFENKETYKSKYGKEGTVKPGRLLWEPATKVWFFAGNIPEELVPFIQNSTPKHTHA